MQLDEWLCIGIPDDVMEQASAWLARLDADHVSLEQRQRLSRWLDADPLHRWAFEELSQLYARAATLSQVRAQIDAPQVLLFPQAPKPAARAPASDACASAARGMRWQAVAVLTLIAIGLGFGIEPPGDTAATRGLYLQPLPVQPAAPVPHTAPARAVPTNPGFGGGD